MAITIQSIKVEGVKYMQLVQLEISHAANEYARARLVLIINEARAKEFMEKGGAENIIKISAKEGNKTTVLFRGYTVNVNFQLQVGYNLMTIDLRDPAYLLDIKRLNNSFQKLDAKYKEILEPQINAAQGYGDIQFKVDDKPIEKMIVQLNETTWEFIKRMASQLNASVFTSINAGRPIVTIGLPDSQNTVEIKNGDFSSEFNFAQFNFIESNPQLLAEGVDVVADDFLSVKLAGPFPYLMLGDELEYKDTVYRIKEVDARFIADGTLRITYTLVGENGFFVPKVAQKNLRGRIFHAEVKKVDKDKIQAHLLEIDHEYDANSTMWFPFATPYSSADGSGWYVMPEEKDYVRIVFPSDNAGDAFAISSVNTAPLAEPKNKSLKAPGGRELLLTDKGIEIIAEHQETFIRLNMDDGISIVSKKDIILHADGNISFAADGNIEMLAKKQIAVQSGKSHVKILTDQIDMGANSVFIGE